MTLKLNPSKGKMFENVDYTVTIYQGCDIECKYDWTQFVGAKPISHIPKMVATPKDLQTVLDVRDSTIFPNSAHDWLANCIPDAWIRAFLNWINIQDPSNRFYLQSKNIPRSRQYLSYLEMLKKQIILGTTIETNRDFILEYSKAPHPEDRYNTLRILRHNGFHTRLSMEPLYAFDPDVLIEWVRRMAPEEVMIGLDNYRHRHKLPIPEPTLGDYQRLRDAILHDGISKLVEKQSIKEWYHV